MKFSNRTKADISKYMMYGVVVAVLLSAVGWIGADIWLASTQWLLVAAVLGLLGVYLRLG